MKKLLGVFLAFLLMSSTASALTLTLEDWKFNPNGVDNTLQTTFSPIDEITILGTALINGTVDSFDIVTGAASGTFKEYGTYEATAFQNDNTNIDGTGLGAFAYTSQAYEITFEMFDTEGYFAYNPVSQVNDYIFTQSKFNIYLDMNNDYGTTADTFGADNGVLIGAFELVAGSGSMDFLAVNGPDGSTDITYKARDDAETQAAGLTHGLLANVFFDAYGVDLSTYAVDDLLIGLVDTNNEIQPSSATQFSEYNGKDGLVSGDYDPTLGSGNTKFFVTSDGSFAPAVVPEPTTMILFGFGLMGLAGIGRRKIS